MKSDITDRRELFVDHFLVDRLDGAGLHMHVPVPVDTALTNGASLTVGEDLVIGYSRDGRNEAVLRMDDGTTLDVGRDLIAGVGTYDHFGNTVAPTTLRGDAVTIGRNLVIAVDADGMFRGRDFTRPRN